MSISMRHAPKVHFPIPAYREVVLDVDVLQGFKLKQRAGTFDSQGLRHRRLRSCMAHTFL